MLKIKKYLLLFVFAIFFALIFVGCATTSGNGQNQSDDKTISGNVDFTENWQNIALLDELIGSWACSYERVLSKQITNLDSECKIMAQNQIICEQNADSSFAVSFLCNEDFSVFMAKLSKKYKANGFLDANPDYLWSLFKNYSFSSGIEESSNYQIQSKTEYANVSSLDEINLDSFLINYDKTKIQQTFEDGTILVYNKIVR